MLQIGIHRCEFILLTNMVFDNKNETCWHVVYALLNCRPLIHGDEITGLVVNCLHNTGN
jgi:hypothetical protein